MNIKCILATALTLFTLQAHATEFIATNTYLIGSTSIVEDEVWVLSAISTTDGTFENDLNIITGSPLILNGRYNGNVTGAASIEAALNGVCERNLRLFSQTVKINGAVAGNLMVIADTVVISTNAVIEGDALILANSVVQEGLIEGDASITASRIATLAGTIGGNTRITSQDILLTPGTRLQGDLLYKAPKILYPDEGIIDGRLQRILPPALLTSARLYKIGIWFMAAFIAGIPFITLFPMTTAMATQLIKRSPLKCLLVGLLASGALPIFGIMSISSLVGVPLGALLLTSWGIMVYLSRIIMGLTVGTMLLRRKNSSIGFVLAAMALGLAVIYASTIFPAIGVPVQMIVLWLGMGSLILSLLEKRRLILQVPHNLKKLEELRDEKFNSEEDKK
ncbi:polymer-forming cytoskeletal protein [Pontiellaceae bacterium B12219]|nr:polymer-forming cytoskeletal protein [Pontiellaceae bacterium B12219]